MAMGNPMKSPINKGFNGKIRTGGDLRNAVFEMILASLRYLLGYAGFNGEIIYKQGYKQWKIHENPFCECDIFVRTLYV